MLLDFDGSDDWVLERGHAGALEELGSTVLSVAKNSLQDPKSLRLLAQKTEGSHLQVSSCTRIAFTKAAESLDSDEDDF